MATRVAEVHVESVSSGSIIGRVVVYEDGVAVETWEQTFTTPDQKTCEAQVKQLYLDRQAAAKAQSESRAEFEALALQWDKAKIALDTTEPVLTK